MSTQYRHSQPGYLMIIISVILFVVAVFMYAYGQQQPAIFLGAIGIFIIVFGYKLTVEIKDGFFRFWFGPGIFWKNVPLEQIAYCGPFKGTIFGWGIHVGPGGWLYNVSGMKAVTVVLKSGKKMHIGTDEPQRLVEAVNSAIHAFGTNDASPVWAEVKTDYLKKVEQALSAVRHPRSFEILADVSSHLDRRFAELGPQQQTWENFQNIIAAMGPPSDYAELLGENTITSPAEIGIWRRFVVNAALSLAIIATIVLFAQIMNGFLPYKKVFSTQPFQRGSFTVDTYMTPLGRYTDNTKYPFIDDPNVIGKWVTVDFVRNPEDFTLGEKHWKWDLWFKGITFFKGGTTNWAWNWTKGLLLHTGGDHTASHYIIKTIDGSQYMFFEWKSGDYTILHRKPLYYVLKKETGAAADDYVQKAEQIVRLMSQKRFEAVVDSFDATMKAALPSLKLAEVWVQLEQAGGEFKGIDGPARTEQQGSMTVIFVPGKWEHNELDFKIVFNSNGKVRGLWTVAPAPRIK